MSKLGQVVFIIEETTTPHGVGALYHLRGTELWTWGYMGNFPQMKATFETEAEAQEALGAYRAYDFWNCPYILAFKDRADAEECLSRMLQENL